MGSSRQRRAVSCSTSWSRAGSSPPLHWSTIRRSSTRSCSRTWSATACPASVGRTVPAVDGDQVPGAQHLSRGGHALALDPGLLGHRVDRAGALGRHACEHPALPGREADVEVAGEDRVRPERVLVADLAPQQQPELLEGRAAGRQREHLALLGAARGGAQRDLGDQPGQDERERTDRHGVQEDVWMARSSRRGTSSARRAGTSASAADVALSAGPAHGPTAPAGGAAARLDVRLA